MQSLICNSIIHDEAFFLSWHWQAISTYVMDKVYAMSYALIETIVGED
jgi:hypothetical protein